MDKIPFMKLSDSFPEIYDEIELKMREIIKNTQFIGGEETALFEKEFASYAGTEHTVGCSNGTDALILALKTLDVGQGDYVITQPNTFIATAEAITAVGATPLFVDIDPETYTISPEKLETFLENTTIKNIKVVVPVHLFGQMTDMHEIKRIADKFNLKIVEDAAQAHGAELDGKRAGYFGDLTSFSFYPGKNLGAFGDAGALATNSYDLYKKAKMLINHGRWKEKYIHEIIGFNKRIDNMQAAILRIKLKYLRHWTDMKIEKANHYRALLKGSNVTLPLAKKGRRHVYHLFVIESEKRDKLQQFLKENGVSSGIHYPLPIHLQPAYKFLGYKKGDFPAAEKAAERILSLPLWPEMPEESIERVCSLII